MVNPLRITTTENGFISVNGTPTDCVHIAVTGLLTEMPDMVISGINEGSNLSDDVLYSGTVAAAMEGRFLGVSSIAVSLAGPKCVNYETAAEITSQLVLHLKNDPLPQHTILNVNVPDLPFEELKGIQITRLGTRHIAEPTIKTVDAGPGTDFHAVNAGYVSITPLHLDLTHYEVFEQLSGWVKAIDIGK